MLSSLQLISVYLESQWVGGANTAVRNIDSSVEEEQNAGFRVKKRFFSLVHLKFPVNGAGFVAASLWTAWYFSSLLRNLEFMGSSGR